MVEVVYKNRLIMPLYFLVPLISMRLYNKTVIPVFVLLLAFAIICDTVLYSPILISDEYLRGYDALTHIFFSSGYFNDWWNSWDLRWYGGYSKFTYPPLSHQIVAILTFLTRDIELSYQLVAWVMLVFSPIAMYIFCRNFSNPLSSSVTSLLFAFAPPIRSIVFVFGQFAGFNSLVFALITGGVWGKYLRQGTKKYLFASIFFCACTFASHHNTAIYFLPGALGAISLVHLLKLGLNRTICLRIFISIALMIALSLIVILPFWLWIPTLTMQTPIPHPSRENFIYNQSASKFFFFDFYGPLLIFIPFVTFHAIRQNKTTRVVGIFFLFYGILGLGGTTALPAIVFGHWWAWLTYERFGVWASIFLIILSGGLFANVKGVIHSFIILLATVLLIFFTFSWIISPQPYRSTPERISPMIIDKIFEEFIYCNDRFLALGFTYQLPDFSIRSDAHTLDGLWHTARSDSLLRQSGVGSLSDALQWTVGATVLSEFLSRSEPIAANCIILNEKGPEAVQFKKIISNNHWYQTKTYDDTVSLWINKRDIISENSFSSILKQNLTLNIIWGTLPLGFFILAVVTTILIITDYLYEISRNNNLSS